MERYQGGRTRYVAGSSPVVPIGCRGEVNNSGHGRTHRDCRHLSCGVTRFLRRFSRRRSPHASPLERSRSVRSDRVAHDHEAAGSNPVSAIRSAEALCRAAVSATPTVRPPSAKALGNILRERAAGGRLSRDSLPDRQQGTEQVAQGDWGLTPRLTVYPSEGIGRPVDCSPDSETHTPSRKSTAEPTYVRGTRKAGQDAMTSHRGSKPLVAHRGLVIAASGWERQSGSVPVRFPSVPLLSACSAEAARTTVKQPNPVLANAG